MGELGARRPLCGGFLPVDCSARTQRGDEVERTMSAAFTPLRQASLLGEPPLVTEAENGGCLPGDFWSPVHGWRLKESHH